MLVCMQLFHSCFQIFDWSCYESDAWQVWQLPQKQYLFSIILIPVPFLLLFVSLTETYLYLVLLMNLMIHIRYSKSNVKMTVRTYIEMIKSNVATIALLVCFCSAIFVMHLTSVDGLYGFESEPLPTLFTERTTLTITVCWLSTSQ